MCPSLRVGNSERGVDRNLQESHPPPGKSSERDSNPFHRRTEEETVVREDERKTFTTNLNYLWHNYNLNLICTKKCKYLTSNYKTMMFGVKQTY